MRMRSVLEIVKGIHREAVRLCGIRQEPLEIWIKDADVPELKLNSLVMAEAFLQLLATGLGGLILVSATAVVLGGFSTKIKKQDFWYITAIGITQTAKVVGSISGPTARFFVQFPAASLHRVISTWTWREHVGDVTEFVGVASMVPIVFAAAPTVTALACNMLSAYGLSGAVYNYGGSDTDPKRGNMKPALIVFYSLVLTQGTLFLLWCGVSIDRSNATLGFSHEYFGIGNTSGKELLDTQTQDKCIEKGVFSTTNRTLVSFAAELLQSEHRSDHVSAISVLRVLTTRTERAAGAVEQICSSEQVVGSLFKLLRAQIPLDLDTKAETAEILTKLACYLRLTDIPGAAHSISSLLDPHPRLMKTAAQEPPAPGVAHRNAGCHRLLTMGLGANEGGVEPSSPQVQTNNTNEGGARDKPLIVHGLMILDKLASDPGNCTEICKTTDLVPKILAPLTHGLLSTIGNHDHKTIQIVKASLSVVAKLVRGTCESSSKLRREIVSKNGRAAGNIIWILRNRSSEVNMRRHAVEILTKLTLGVPRMRGFIADLKVLLLFYPQNSPLRVSAGKALNALAVDYRNRKVIWEQVAEDFPSLVAAMNDAGNSTLFRAVTAELLAQICAKSVTDVDRMHRLSSVTNSLSKVLEAILNTEIADMSERRKFFASFLALAVQIRENLVTPEAFAIAVRGLSTGTNIFPESVFYFERYGPVSFRFIKFAEKLKEIIVEMTKMSEDEVCLVITKAAAKLVMWTTSIDPVYAHYFQQEKIVEKLKDIVDAMGDLERCIVLCGPADADEDGTLPDARAKS